MSKRLLVALLGTGFTCATLSAQELPLIHQPTLTPQDSGTTSGLIAVCNSRTRIQVVSMTASRFGRRNGEFCMATQSMECSPIFAQPME